tara:strand:- start:8053 stop:8286 length:234 start_codon:yes stop_codon:yes gene_type:complete
MVSIQIGFPLIVVDKEGVLASYGIKDGDKGNCANYMEFTETNERVVGYQPGDERKVYYFSADRVVVDEDKLKEMRGE